jgi:hypothetical protein
MQGGALIARFCIILFAIFVKPCAGPIEGYPMRSAILAIDLPPDDHGSERQRWSSFSAMIAKTQGNPAVREIAPTVWQVDFHKSPYALGQLIVACEQFGYAYGILQLDGDAQWLRQESALLTAKTGWKIDASG